MSAFLCILHILIAVNAVELPPKFDTNEQAAWWIFYKLPPPNDPMAWYVREPLQSALENQIIALNPKLDRQKIGQFYYNDLQWFYAWMNFQKEQQQ